MLTALGFLFGGPNVLAQAPPVPDHGWVFSEQDGETAGPSFGDAAGTLSGGVEWSGEDPFGAGGSVSFDGSDGTVVMEDLATAFNGLSNFSLSIWIKANDTGIDKGFFEAVDSGGGDLWGLRYDSTGATSGGSNVIKLGITTSESGGNTNRGADQQETKEDVQTTEWQHLLMTWEDGEGFNFYIDGELDEPTTAMQTTGGTLSDMDRFVLGDGAKAYWDGYIDEVAVWTSTLTADNAAWLAKNSIAGLGGGNPLRDGLTGYWPLDEGDGTIAANAAGGADAELYNGVEWVDDADRGMVLSFDGVDAYADAGAETIPQMTQENDFTWSAWINQGSGNGPNNVVLGNRYSPDGGDFAPREFIKYTPTKFEFHLDGGGQNCEYDDLASVEGEWVHYVVVKTGNTLTHYSNGEEGESSTFTSELQNPQPFYFGGDKTAENWNGMLDDIAIWNRALSASEVADVHANGIPSDVTQVMVGLNFGADEGGGAGALGADDTAGVTGSEQSNWNNLDGAEGSSSDIVDATGAATGMTVSWTSNNTWASTGRGEENNAFSDGPDKALLTGYLDTGAATTTAVTITDIPAELAMGFNVVCYLTGGVPHKGGGYWVEDADGNILGTNALATFESDFEGDLDSLVSLGGVAKHEEGVIKITENIGSQLGGFTVADFTDGATFTDFEVTFRAFIGEGTDRPADGLSLSVGSGMADAISEEGDAGAALRFCFDTWDNGGAEAPSIDIFNGSELLVAQKFDGVGTSGEERFEKDDGEFLYIWDDEEWADVKIRVAGGFATIEFRGYTVIDREPIEVEPIEGADFLFGGRTGGANEKHYVDDLKITILAPAIMIGDADANLEEYVLDPGVDHEDKGNFVVIPGVSGDSIVVKAVTADGYGNAEAGQGAVRAPLNAVQLVGTAGGGEATPPMLAKVKANAGGLTFQIKDSEGGAAANADSVAVSVDGAAVEVTKSDKVDGAITVSYTATELFASESTHALSVELTDSMGNAVKLDKEFKVKAYKLVGGGLAVPESLKGESGFLVYPTQISSGQGVGDLHGNSWQVAEQQIRGELIDPDTEEQWLNEADFDSFEGWSWYPEIVETVNQNQDAPGAAGNFSASGDGDAQDREDEPLTGIPGWGDSTDGIASEYIALLELEKGSYRFGVNSDDGFSASIGANFSDALGEQLGLFDGGRGASSTDFDLYVAEAGLYPYRVSWWEGGGGANVEIYSYVDGEKVLINDPDVEGSIKAYTVKDAVVDESTTERVSTGRPYIVSVSPSPGGVAKGGIVVVAKNDSDSITKSSIELALNGESVAADVSTDGDTITIVYDPEGGFAVGDNTATLSYDESNGKSRSIDWSFKVPRYYTPAGAPPAEPLGLVSVIEWHGIGGGGVNSGYNHAKYPDSPDFQTLAGYFEWPQTGDPEVTPASNVRDNYLWTIRGYYYPPETGEYRFYFCTDDNAEYFLSTDEKPANARLIAKETGWHPIRDYQAVEDEATSDMIFLEEGKPYYIEMVNKEAGGGDNAALVIVTPSDEDREVIDGETPVLGKYFSPFIMAVPDAVDLTITEQPSDATAEKNTTAQFSIGLSHDVGQVFWKLNGNVVDQGLVFTTPELGDEHDGAKVQAIVIYNGSQVSNEVTLTVTPDTTAPAVIATDASRFLNTLSLTYSEDMDEASAGEASNYNVAGLSVDSVELNGRTVTLSTGDQTPGKVYTVSVSGVSDPAGNEFNADVSIQAYVEATGFLWWDVWTGIGGAHPMENLTENENYPDNPNWSQLMPWTNSRWATGFHNNANDNYGARMSGLLVAPETGEYRIWLRSDDHGQVWISTDEDPENVELIAEETGCCKGFTLDDGGLSGIVELEKGQRYYFEALLKEGGGGDWMNVGWTRPNDEGTEDLDGLDVPPWNDGGISGEHFVNYIPAQDPNPADIFSQGTGAPASGSGGLLVREFHGIGGSYLGDLFTNPKWPNSPDLVTWSNHAEWPQNASGDINDVPAGNVQDNYATQLLGFVHPPETGDYQFFLAADDRTILYISSDESPTNKRLVALEPVWNGVRAFGGTGRRVVVDNDTGRQINGSAPISMEAGKAYFIEAISKEGGGGDNLAITWIRAGDDLPADGALPIAGEHLSPWIAPPSEVNNGDGTLTFETHLAWEWWDGIGGAHPMENLTDNPRYPDFPDGATWAPSWNTRTALCCGFDGNGRNSYGGRMSGVLTAPETGTYRFFIASDDHGLLRISTDADPANAVRVAEETGCCKNFTVDDGGLSGTVDLVAGNQYYMEALLKEGGGGDWLSVGWRMPSEDIDVPPAGGQNSAESIPGKYFTGTVTVPALPALSSSLSVSAGNSMDTKTGITLNVSNGATTLDAGSVAISLNGNALAATVTEGTWSKSFGGAGAAPGRPAVMSVAQEAMTYSIAANTGDIEAGVEHTVSATFKDSAGETTTHDATFTIPVWELYGIGTKAPAEAAGSISVRQYQGIGGGFNNLITSFKFPDSPDFEERVGYLEWPQTGDINTKPAGNVQDSYGVQMIGFLHPPATADYQFAIASDDNSQLWLSTDENPANRVLIAKETGWQPIRKYQPVGDEATSEFISLEAGKAYYIEILNKEGGGGDNVAVAWTTGDPIVPDALPISGDYLSPWVPEYEGPVDITSAGDAVVPSSDNHPAGEHAGLAFDNNARTKYLNRDGANDQPSGLTITTGGGVVTGMSLTSANDAPDRDPATFILSGSNDGGATFAEIASGDVPAFSNRFERVEVSFDNSVAYTTYQVTFPTTTGPSTCCMQIAEIQLLGTGAEPEAPDNLVANGSFEVDDVPEWPGYGAITDWEGGSGINDGGPFGDNGVIPDGAKLGFIQGTRTLSQQLTGLEAGAEYVLSFSYNARNCCGGTIGFTVSVGGEELGSVSDVKPVGAENAYNSASYNFVAAGTEAELVFSATAAGDATLLLDAVSVSKAGGGDAPPALSIVNNGDGTVTVTFEGRLEAAASVNGPWQDTGATSPLTTPADAAMQYARAVKD